jgi:hypothetical protein
MRQIVLWLALTSSVGYILGYFKRRPKWGFWLGFALGPVGWGITLMLPKMPTPCPGCGNPVEEKATACPSCGRVLVDVRYEVK